MGFTGMISAASVILLLAGAPAEKTYSLQDALQICARIQNPTDRLACFEGLAKSTAPSAGGETATAPATAPAPKAPATATEQRAAKAATAVTASEQRAASKERKRKIEESVSKRQPYEAVVMRAWQYGNGDYYIALTNGEIWKVDARDKLRPVKDSEAVELRPGAIGSWFMQFKTLKRPDARVNLVE